MDSYHFFIDSIPEIYRQYYAAHMKHPIFEEQGPASQIVMEELGEVCQALNDKNYKQADIEIDQTITTLLRWKRMIKEGMLREDAKDESSRGHRCASKNFSTLKP